jgi:hypothetical protein
VDRVARDHRSGGILFRDARRKDHGGRERSDEWRHIERANDLVRCLRTTGIGDNDDDAIAIPELVIIITSHIFFSSSSILRDQTDREYEQWIRNDRRPPFTPRLRPSHFRRWTSRR